MAKEDRQAGRKEGDEPAAAATPAVDRVPASQLRREPPAGAGKLAIETFVRRQSDTELLPLTEWYRRFAKWTGR